MLRNILPLALQGIRRKKRNSILIFSVLLLSFAFAITSVSLVGSISKTNEEFRLNTYGEWYFAIPAGLEEDSAWLHNQIWAETIGVSHSYGYVPTEAGVTGFGTVDDDFKTVGRLKLDAGRWPEANNEIVMEADTLGLLGYDYTLGQEITIPIFVPSGEKSIISSGTFVLCGIVREYTDLWVLNRNSSNQLLNGAIVTEECAKQVLKDAEALLTVEATEQGIGANPPVPQYFVSVSPEYWESAQNTTEGYLVESRETGDLQPCVNRVAYSDTTTAEYDEFYAFIIAVVAMLAVLCIYIIQLPAETRSFATLRSIGITRGQMGLLLLTEALLLCLPALILGVPCSIGVTWLAMRSLVYAGSVPIQVDIPWEAVHTIVFLWIAVVVVSRLLVYFVTLRTPLTGRMQMQRAKVRRTKILRSAMILLLLMAFGFITVFTSMETLSPNENRKQWESYPPYTLWTDGTISQTDVELLKQVPGVYQVEGFGELPVYLSYPGVEEREVYLYALDERQWDETFHFGEDQEAFHNGELLLILFPDETVYLPEDVDRDFVLPEKNVTLRLYDSSDVCIMESESTPVSIRWISEYTQGKMLAGVIEPYTIVCSETYLQTLLEKMEPGTKWGRKYTAGEPFGYGRVYAYVEPTADDLSTDIGMAELCSRLEITLDNRRQEFTANMQQYSQESLLLYGSGICIALMVLLILASTISLETEHEKRYFTILHRLGMSPWQRRIKIWGKALGRSLCASTSGWLFYIAYKTIEVMKNDIAFAEAVPNLLKVVASYGYNFGYITIVSSICILIPLMISILSKQSLHEGAWEI